MDFSKLAIGGVSVMFVVTGLVEFSKLLGNKGVGLPITAFVLGGIGAGVAGAMSLSLLPESVLPWVQVGAIALGGGISALVACGYYKLAKRVGEFVRKRA